MRAIAVPVLILGTFASLPAAGAKLPFTFDAMMRLARISDPQLSPDGKTAAFVVQTIDLAANTKPTQIYVVPLNGGTPAQITRDGSQNTRPRWTPDSQRIVFVSNRSSGSQIWSMNPDGSDAKQLTNLPTEAEGETVSPDGKSIVFTSEVYPACDSQPMASGSPYDPGCNKRLLDEQAASKMHARVYTQLLYRHWTEYSGTRRKHILVQSIDGGNPRDLTPGDRSVPPFSLGGADAYGFSPDGTEITYVANTDRDLSTSTNTDLFSVSVNGGERKKLTYNPGADEDPLYSPDGRYLAYRTQIRSGYESDLWRLAILERQTGRLTILTEKLDRPVSSYSWSPDSAAIFFTIQDHGHAPLMMMAPSGEGPIRTVAQGPSTIGDVQFTKDGKTMLYSEQSGSRPIELYRAGSAGGPAIALTHLNDAVMNAYQLSPLESFSIAASDGAKVESFVVKPADFNPNNKYPVLFLIHGGPQGEWGESWSYRWNAQVFAAAGYLIVMPNPHGSVGYGQAFTDAVNGDWGGIPYDDIMKTVDHVQELPYVDRDRLAAAGASYGGYMIDWILGSTDRFKALVVHAGVYDLVSEAGTTEELWFPKWEFQGFPWENPGMYERWSPSKPDHVKNFKTPTLVTHGEIDYRVPVGQGQQLFTALQQQKVPSKLILFPDEGHWLLKPQNSQFWYRNVLEWIEQYTKAAAQSTAAK